MPHMTHNYMLGLAVLVFSFYFSFYTPMVYAFFGHSQTEAKAK